MLLHGHGPLWWVAAWVHQTVAPPTGISVGVRSVDLSMGGRISWFTVCVWRGRVRGKGGRGGEREWGYGWGVFCEGLEFPPCFSFLFALSININLCERQKGFKQRQFSFFYIFRVLSLLFLIHVYFI